MIAIPLSIGAGLMDVEIMIEICETCGMELGDLRVRMGNCCKIVTMK
tara:strand:+ start:1278 stop:1418 length:141 start_codon:yes stop_codon:yes gene_type:complete